MAEVFLYTCIILLNKLLHKNMLYSDTTYISSNTSVKRKKDLKGLAINLIYFAKFEDRRYAHML